MKRRYVALALGAGLLIALVVGLALRGSQPREEAPATTQDPVATALQDAALLDLIQNAKVATLKGDQVTREAMLTGLRRNPRRAREVVETTIARASDIRDRDALQGLLREINP
jgi:hypothetical protein